MRENAPVSVLADRYASTAMRQVFAPEEKIIAERKLWLAVARAQAKLGHAISDAVIADYEKVISKVDLASIDAREKVTRHDVKARIEEFNALAGHEAIHAGMTSRDLTENIEALQIRDGLAIVHDKTVALLAALAHIGPATPTPSHRRCCHGRGRRGCCWCRGRGGGGGGRRHLPQHGCFGTRSAAAAAAAAATLPWGVII